MVASLKELALLFIRLGATAFGGPAAHIAIMQDEVVRRRGWLSSEEFLDLLGATSLIPGPSSTEMAVYIGRLRAGLAGIVVAGACFILPAVIIVTAIAWAYVRFGSLPQVSGLLYGVKPAVIAVVAQALWGLRRAAVKSALLAALGVIALAASFAGANVLIVLLGAGLIAGSTKFAADRLRSLRTPGLLGAAPFGLLPLFLFFLKVGAVLFGSGYVLLAFLRADLVQHYGWLTQGKLLDAIAVGQVTPVRCSPRRLSSATCSRESPRRRRHGGDLSAVVLLCGTDRPAVAAHPPVPGCRSIPGWDQCGSARTDDIRNLATGRRRDRGYPDCGDCCREHGGAADAAPEYDVAHRRRSGGRPDNQIGLGAREGKLPPGKKWTVINLPCMPFLMLRHRINPTHPPSLMLRGRMPRRVAAKR